MPDVARDLDDVIFKLMQKEPEERFESPAYLLQALDKVRIQHGLEAHGFRPPRASPIIALVAAVARRRAPPPATRPDETIRVEDPEVARLAEAAAQSSARSTTTSSRTPRTTSASSGQEAQNNLKIGDNWSKPIWPALVGEYRSFAEELVQSEKYGERKEVGDVAEEDGKRCASRSTWTCAAAPTRT